MYTCAEAEQQSNERAQLPCQDLESSRTRWEVIGHILKLIEIHSGMNGSNDYLVELLKFSRNLYSKGILCCIYFIYVLLLLIL